MEIMERAPYRIVISEDWEELVDTNGVTIASAHQLDAGDVLLALGIPFEYEDHSFDDEPYDIDSDMGFDPYMGCFSDDC